MNRKGFSLVEVLVVFGIIGILIALLIPAIMAAREAAIEKKKNIADILPQLQVTESFEIPMGWCRPQINGAIVKVRDKEVIIFYSSAGSICVIPAPPPKDK